MANDIDRLMVAGAVILAVPLLTSPAEACRDGNFSSTAFVKESPASEVRDRKLKDISVMRIELLGAPVEVPLSDQFPRAKKHLVSIRVLETVDGWTVPPGDYTAEFVLTSCFNGFVAPDVDRRVWYIAGRLGTGRTIDLANFGRPTEELW
jgi:hypothetical protein